MRESQYLSDSIICPRCEQPGTRAIGRAICTTCRNKQNKEMKKRPKIDGNEQREENKAQPYPEEWKFGKCEWLSFNMRPQV